MLKIETVPPKAKTLDRHRAVLLGVMEGLPLERQREIMAIADFLVGRLEVVEARLEAMEVGMEALTLALTRTPLEPGPVSKQSSSKSETLANDGWQQAYLFPSE